METVVGLFGLRGRLEPLRDWDYPDDREAFDIALCRQVAACFNDRSYASIWRLSEQAPNGRRVYEVTVGRGHGGGFSPRATIFATTEASTDA